MTATAGGGDLGVRHGHPHGEVPPSMELARPPRHAGDAPGRLGRELAKGGGGESPDPSDLVESAVAMAWKAATSFSSRLVATPLPSALRCGNGRRTRAILPRPASSPAPAWKNEGLRYPKLDLRINV
jgi:hypothetical protein